MKNDYTVVDGETVEKKDELTADKPESHTEQKKKQLVPSSRRSDWLARALAILALGGVAWLWQQNKLIDTLIEAQNTLNSRVQAIESSTEAQAQQLAALNKEVTTLKSAVNTLQGQLAEVQQKLESPEHAPVVTQADLDALKKQFETIEAQLQGWVQRWQEAIKNITPPPAEDQEEGTDVQTVPPVIQTLQQQMEKMGEQLAQLFNQPAPAAAPAQPNTAGVDPMTLQQWLLRTNTEWLLAGDVALTQSRLHSLEQMVQLSELPNESKIKLLRAIGQDLVYLEQYAKTQQNAEQAIAPLRAWVQELQPATKPLQQTKTAPDLMARLKGLVEIRKRDEGLSTPEQLMAFDLTKQRALLLVDQLAWAYNTHTVTLFEQTKQRLRALFKQALPEQLSVLEAQLVKLPMPKHPQPLKSVEAL